jgi:hypothetical protein
MDGVTSAGGEEPVLRIVNADATPDEVAAIVAVFASLRQTEERPPVRPSAWNAPHRTVRPGHRHGPDGWRSSGLAR